MKNLHISLNHMQKLRLRKALEKLESLSLNPNSSSAVSVADTIPVNHEDGVLKGHGTSEIDGEVVATVCGIVERVNKLVYVRSLRSRYKPEIGDIIVGRVTEVAQKRWRLDINFSQDAVLMISSMNMPDGLQRRRTAVDELNMRSIFEENDVVCAEVRSIQHDGGLQLQARSQKYGKLERGQLVVVPAYLVKRRKQHFHHLKEYGVDLILGCNGYIWIGDHVETRGVAVGETERTGSDCVVGLEKRESISRMANAVRVLAGMGFNITAEEVVVVTVFSRSHNIEIYDMLGSEFHVLLAEAEAERRGLSTRKK